MKVAPNVVDVNPLRRWPHSGNNWPKLHRSWPKCSTDVGQCRLGMDTRNPAARPEPPRPPPLWASLRGARRPRGGAALRRPGGPWRGLGGKEQRSTRRPRRGTRARCLAQRGCAQGPPRVWTRRPISDLNLRDGGPKCGRVRAALSRIRPKLGPEEALSSEEEEADDASPPPCRPLRSR